MAPSYGKAMGSSLSKGSSGYLGAVDVTVNTDKTVYAADDSEIMEFTLERGTNASSYALSFTSDDGQTYYLAAPSTSTTLSRTASKSTSNNVTITQGASLATLLFVKNSRRLNYGTANGGCFQAYASTSASKVLIYKKQSTSHKSANVGNSAIVNFVAPANEEVDDAVLLLNSDDSTQAAGSGSDDATLYGVAFDATDAEGNTLCTLQNTYAKTYYPGAYSDLVRWFKNAVMTLTPASGYSITRVEVEYKGATYSGPFSAPVGEVTQDDDHELLVWKGSTTSPLDLTALDQIRFSSMSVTLKPVVGEIPSTEQFETPVGMYVMLDNEAGWEHPYAYTWTEGDLDRNSPWPGVAMTRSAADSETWIYQFDADKAPGFVIFNNGVVGSGVQTEDLEYVNGATYSNTEFDGIHELFLVGSFTDNWSFLDDYRFQSEDGVAYSLSVPALAQGAEFKVASRYYSPLDFGGASAVMNGASVVLTSGTSVNNVIGESVTDATVLFNIDTAELNVAGLSDVVTGADSLSVDEPGTEYYNLQGMRIARPANGVVIMRRGSQTVKVLIRD